MKLHERSARRAHHKTIKIYENYWQNGKLTEESMDEVYAEAPAQCLVDIALSMIPVGFRTLALSSVAVYKLPNYTTGRIDHFLTVVAHEEEGEGLI